MAISFAAISVEPVQAQGYRPDEAAQKMAVAAGMHVELVASEPLVRQPVAIDFDDRGRLWVIQYLQYPNPAGLKPVSVDRFSRTTYDRLPEPPPHGPKGEDRITILIDRDGDGRADNAKDFVAGLNLASGFAFGYGGVFVLQAPYLLFYPDRNGDDVPDADPDVLLAGFGMEDAHSVANSLTWGPDGWLYGCQGSTVTAHIRGIEFQQGVWRYHPMTHRFELFCEGGGNSWGLDFDRQGNLLYSTNYGGHVMLHGVQGGYYWKSFGKHGALHNPYAYGYFDHVQHRDFRGGHVTVGGVVYRGHTLPALRDRYVAADLLGHAMYWNNFEPVGSTFVSSHVGDLLAANDTWFAPSDVCVGPDGAIYVADWHDKRTAHPDPNADWDRTNGRIYRIQASAAAPTVLPDFSSLTSLQLVELLKSENGWLANRARRILAERRDSELILPLREAVLDERGSGAIELLWALYASGGLSEPYAMKLLDHSIADVRRWAIRLIGDEQLQSNATLGKLVQRAAIEVDAATRSQLAATGRRLDAKSAIAVVLELGKHAQDVSDLHVPLMLWWAVEPHAITARDVCLAGLATQAAWESKLLRSAVLPRLLRRYAAEHDDAGFLACARLFEAAPNDAFRLAALPQFAQGLSEQAVNPAQDSAMIFTRFAAAQKTGTTTRSQRAVIPAELRGLLERMWASAPDNVELIELMARLRSARARQASLDLALLPTTDAAVRERLLRLQGEIKNEDAIRALLKTLHSGANVALKLAALDALQRFETPEIANSLLDGIQSFDAGLRMRAMDVLLSRADWTQSVLNAVDQRRLPPAALSADQLRLVALHNNEQLNELVTKHWGSVKGGTPEEKLAEMRRLNNDLRAAAGDAARGRELFATHCAVCHRLYDEGNQVGPELTHANRKDRDYLLASIVDPSAVIRKEYLNFVIQTTGGRILSGLLVDQSTAMVTLLGARNERTSIPRDEIETIKQSSQSLMPEDLLKHFKPSDVRDLFSYLQSDGPGAKAPANAAIAPQAATRTQNPSARK